MITSSLFFYQKNISCLVCLRIVWLRVSFSRSHSLFWASQSMSAVANLFLLQGCESGSCFPCQAGGGGSEVNLLRALTEGGQSVSKDVTGTQRGRSWVIALGGCIGAENASCPLLRRSFWFARGLQINNPKFDVAEARVRYWWLGRKSCSRSDQWSQCRLGLGVYEWQSDMQLSGTALCQEGGMSF